MSERKLPAKRVFYLSLILFAALTTDFLLLKVMPGDPALAFLPEGAPPEVIDMVREGFHLDDLLRIKSCHYIVDTLPLDFGVAITYPPPGSEDLEIVEPRLFNTLLLIGVGLIIVIFAGASLEDMPLGGEGRPLISPQSLRKQPVG
jgi:peptide/nickel transport system permease protein